GLVLGVKLGQLFVILLLGSRLPQDRGREEGAETHFPRQDHGGHGRQVGKHSLHHSPPAFFATRPCTRCSEHGCAGATSYWAWACSFTCYCYLNDGCALGKAVCRPGGRHW